MSLLFFRFRGVLKFTGFDTDADGAVDGLWFTVSLVQALFVFGVDEGVMAVLADFDLVGHKDILYFVE
ncbi:MAG: hypothetical protein UX08_C0013G0007 [Candidatus Collierbacteria bacterium GW2011_GWB1_45_35]|uniref:Uncharacterized protein n=1 Tax=Candidatus Collierbacteria bacterium GW2011_GWB2_45_17 TaxID=1618388 RepID=A0A837IHT4_9BACT|nr:MAG: hypothetical protein UW48_C0008G0007 [Microgenomates group bacterium GW2011_GWC1_44_23]KKT95340.1 MAG: hypothetical protein UW96_C0008G0007 [Candidatus Collierbacteria bacterium GW2011_GWA1_45_15]KKT99610.1 MAG: hypothetical protein UX01_C0009G0040 [Candidatus Collierbacteria bacterium GW2011_GWB2_45_17]KKU04917.1 MAG: hypothetical protein UX08_C0013G0007 [Candidatus Collierbacteria bacterium GW2011_GWB1_45_35]KKU06995.1 MAG: hypothetical protein UX11_C0022G0028 [Candidatus Collierbacte